MRCPSISTLSDFKVFQNESIFLAAALPGKEPPQGELDQIWQECVKKNGLKADHREAWTEFPAWAAELCKSKDKKQANATDGSMLHGSWKTLRTKLLHAFQTRSDTYANAPCTFVDAGSESGKGLFQMMGDTRVTHVAGIEFQLLWFQLSQKIFNDVRIAFQERGYRMPEVTLIHSCMLAQTPVLKWLYSISSIMWMNNFVFDKYVYFDSTDPKSAKFKGKSLLANNKHLSANAAFNFSQKFEETTFIAVHRPEYFLDIWSYKECEAFEVSCTWSQASTKEDVTILVHTQHVKLSDYSLSSPTTAALHEWDRWTQKWSDDAKAGIETEEPSFEYFETNGLKTKIPWRHFSRLSDRNWLSDDLLRAYMTLLQKEFPSTYFHQYLAGVETKKLKSLTKQFGADMNVFFYNLNNTHWMGVKLEKSNKRILVYDSLPGNHETQFKQIEDLANKLGVEGPFDHIEVTVPDQKNPTDCGVTTCLFMLCMALNIDDELIYDSPSVCRQFRKTLFADILNQKVTLLKRIKK
jgi:hypothetical protein